MKRLFASLIIFGVSLTLLSAAVTTETELANAKKLLYETARILESKNNQIVVDEVASYDWFWVKDTQFTSHYIRVFNETLADNKSIHAKRERLQYLFNQDRSRQVSALVPNAANILTIAFTAGDPLKSIIAVSGTVLSSVTSYVNEKQQAELELIQKNWELDDQQTQLFVRLLSELRGYLSQVSDKYGLTNEQLASDQTLRQYFLVLREKSDPREKLLSIDTRQFRTELGIFPEYWRELATISYELEDYDSALSHIEEYENRYVQTMYHDNAHANLMQIKAYCLIKLYPYGVERNNELVRLADEIERMSLASDWMQQYFCVELYLTMLEGQESSDADKLKAKTVNLMQEVLTKVANQYSIDLENYLKGRFVALTIEGIEQNIEEHNDLVKQLETRNKSKNIGKTEQTENKANIKRAKDEIKTLKENKKNVKRMEEQILPPNTSLLFALAKQYFDLAEEFDVASTQVYQLLRKKISELLVDNHSKLILFDLPSSIKSADLIYTNRKFLFVNRTDYAELYIPATWSVFTKDRLDPKLDPILLNIGGYHYDVGEYDYTVIRGAENTLDNLLLKISFNIKGPIETGIVLRKGTVPLVTMFFDSEINQDIEPVFVKVNNTDDMLKTFQFTWT